MEWVLSTEALKAKIPFKTDEIGDPTINHCNKTTHECTETERERERDLVRSLDDGKEGGWVRRREISVYGEIRGL